MKPFILTPRAEQDLSDIWDYTADDSIDVIRVLHGARDIEHLFAEEEG